MPFVEPKPLSVIFRATFAERFAEQVIIGMESGVCLYHNQVAGSLSKWIPLFS